MLKKMEIKDFDQVYTLMEESFPKDEYRDYQKQKELFQNPEYQILIEKDPEFREIKAFFAAWEFETFIYVEHFAVNPILRNGGVGSRMLKALTEDAEKMIILEVEPPTEEIAVRRVTVSYTHLRSHETDSYLVCRLLLEKKKKKI